MTGEDNPITRIRYRQPKPGTAARDLPTELARIAGLDTDGLRSLWLRMTGKPPSGQLSGDLLRRMVMHRVQERCLGGLDRKLATMLDRLADGGGVIPARLKIGSMLTREHGGVVHRVMVVRGGYAWNDRVLPSLSAVAKAITGTKWNGHRFFGLRKTELAKIDGARAEQDEADPSSMEVGEAMTEHSWPARERRAPGALTSGRAW